MSEQYVSDLMKRQFPLWVLRVVNNNVTQEEKDLLVASRGFNFPFLIEDYAYLVKYHAEYCKLIWKMMRTKIPSMAWREQLSILLDAKVPEVYLSERIWSIDLVAHVWKVLANTRLNWIDNFAQEPESVKLRFYRCCPWTDSGALKFIADSQDIKKALVEFDRLSSVPFTQAVVSQRLVVPTEFNVPKLQEAIVLESFDAGTIDNAITVYRPKYETQTRWNELCKDIRTSSFFPIRLMGGPTLRMSAAQTREFFNEIAENRMKHEVYSWNYYRRGYFIGNALKIYFRTYHVGDLYNPSTWDYRRCLIFGMTAHLSNYQLSSFVFFEGFPYKDSWFDSDLCLSLEHIFPREVCEIIEDYFRELSTSGQSYTVPTSSGCNEFHNIRRDEYIMKQLVGGMNMPMHGYGEYSFGELPIHFLELAGSWQFTLGEFRAGSAYVIVPENATSVQISSSVPTFKKVSPILITHHPVYLCHQHESGDFSFNLPGWRVFIITITPDTLLWVNVTSKNRKGSRPFYKGVPVISPAVSEILSTNAITYKCFSMRKIYGVELGAWKNGDGMTGLSYALSKWHPVDQLEYIPTVSLYEKRDGTTSFEAMTWSNFFFNGGNLTPFFILVDDNYLVGGNDVDRISFSHPDAYYNTPLENLLVIPTLEVMALLIRCLNGHNISYRPSINYPMIDANVHPIPVG